MSAFLRGLTVALLCVLVSACSRGGGFTTEGLVVLIDPDDRPDAPALVGETLDGNDISLDDFAGDIVVVNIWGSWCPPCRAEAPVLAELSETLADDGVSFLGIVIRDQRSSARAFEERFGIEYPSIFDPGGRQLLGFANSYPASAVPTTYVIDPQGRIAARILDEVERSTLYGVIEDIAAEDGRELGEAAP